MKFTNLIQSRRNPLPRMIPFPLMIRLSGYKILCVFYHSVSDNVPDHLKNLYHSKSIQEFDNDLTFLLRYYKPLDLFHLKHIIQNGNNQDNYFFVSFDDGLSEFYFNAVPILLKHGLTATNFLNNSFIDNSDLFYRYKISLLIEGLYKHIENRSVMKQFKMLTKHFHMPDNNRDVLLKMTYADQDLINNIAQLFEIDFASYLIEKKPYMTSDQISELIRLGFTFGSHSFDHPKFSEIPDNEKIRQSLDSIDDICSRFKLPYKVFSFPFIDQGFSEQMFDILYTKGIELTFGSSGINFSHENKHIQRLPMEGYFKSGENRIRSYFFFSLMKRFNGI